MSRVTLMPSRGASAFSAPIGEQACSSSTASSVVTGVDMPDCSEVVLNAGLTGLTLNPPSPEVIMAAA